MIIYHIRYVYLICSNKFITINNDMLMINLNFYPINQYLQKYRFSNRDEKWALQSNTVDESILVSLSGTMNYMI